MDKIDDEPKNQTVNIRIDILEEQIHELTNRLDDLTNVVARCERNINFDNSSDWRY